MNAAEQAHQLRLLGRLTQAEQVAREALAATPDDAWLLVTLAAVLYDADRYTDGLAVADAACGAAPQDEFAHRMRAMLLAALGRHEDAVDAATTSVTLAPQEPAAARAHAKVLQHAGRLHEAEQAARRAVQLDPDSAESHVVLATIAYGRGYWSVARQSYTEALRLDPQHAVARHDLAVIDARSRRPARALRGLVDAGGLDPTMPLLLRNVTTVLWKLSWRLRKQLAVAALACGAAAPQQLLVPTASARVAAAVGLLVMGALNWGAVRDLPRQTWPVARTALRSDRPLCLIYGAVVVSLLLLVLTLVTGAGAFAAAVLLVLIVLGVLTIAVHLARWVRAARRG